MVEYVRRRDADAAGILYTLEQSTNMTDWSEIDDIFSSPELTTAPSVRERVRTELPGAETSYVRLRVGLAP